MKNLSMNFTSFKTDSQMLAEAVREAHQKSGTLIIPPVNPRTGERVYIIDETILLPSDMEIVLENCVLKLAPDARCNIFRNENMYKEGYLSKDSEQKNIFIRGIGNAVLDGEGHNDVFEWSSEKDGNPSVYGPRHETANSKCRFYRGLRAFFEQEKSICPPFAHKKFLPTKLL